ncbi:hypothetical protein SLEP1_g2941 [Rubroshorea leprosula]|uniref:CCHC-type domain-containing protein n=1 Tax=Rubroshorea leprosula TaxID=152421 RepID=A0AAV5HSI2_9ROSI|nr:hypothetical protein SLEP1_g2941 [Rubroshorea leprosula]
MVDETPKTTNSKTQKSSSGKTVITTPVVINTSTSLNNIIAFIAAQFPVKLTSDNYTMWSQQFTSLPRVYRLTDFLQGTRPCPPADDIPDSPYDLWVRQDQSILHAIMTSVSESIHPYVSSAETSHEAWVILERLYANSCRTRVNALKERLQNLWCEAHEESLQRKEALVGDTKAPITTQFAFVHPRTVGNPSGYGGFNAWNSVGGHYDGVQAHFNRTSKPNATASPYTNSQFNGYAPKGRRGARGTCGAQGGKNNWNSSNRYNSYNANACQLCNSFGHFARNCPALKNHAHVANFATTSTSKKGDWWIDSGASDHVTPDLATLALHSKYDGSDELLIGDGSADPSIVVGASPSSGFGPQAAVSSAASTVVNQVNFLNPPSLSTSVHDLVPFPVSPIGDSSLTPLAPLSPSSNSTSSPSLDIEPASTRTLPSSPVTHPTLRNS